MRDAFYLGVNPSGHRNKDKGIVTCHRHHIARIRWQPSLPAGLQAHPADLGCLPNLWVPSSEAFHVCLPIQNRANSFFLLPITSLEELLWPALCFHMLCAPWSYSHSLFPVPTRDGCCFSLPYILSPPLPLLLVFPCLDLFHVCEHVVCMYVHTHVCPMPTEAKEGHHILWDWLLLALWMVGTEWRASKRIASAFNLLNHFLGPICC